MEVYLTPDKGWGVRAAAFIPRGTFVVEYAGEVRALGGGPGGPARWRVRACFLTDTWQPGLLSLLGMKPDLLAVLSHAPCRWWMTRSAAGEPRRPRPATSRTFT